jgi:hypothetical protein
MSPETCHKQTGTLRVGNWADVDSFVFFNLIIFLSWRLLFNWRGAAPYNEENS